MATPVEVGEGRVATGERAADRDGVETEEQEVGVGLEPGDPGVVDREESAGRLMAEDGERERQAEETEGEARVRR